MHLLRTNAGTFAFASAQKRTHTHTHTHTNLRLAASNLTPVGDLFFLAVGKSIGRFIWALRDVCGTDDLCNTLVAVWRKLAISYNPQVRLGVAYSLPAVAVTLGAERTLEMVVPVQLELMADVNVKVSALAPAVHPHTRAPRRWNRRRCFDQHPPG